MGPGWSTTLGLGNYCGSSPMVSVRSRNSIVQKWDILWTTKLGVRQVK